MTITSRPLVRFSWLREYKLFRYNLPNCERVEAFKPGSNIFYLMDGVKNKKRLREIAFSDRFRRTECLALEPRGINPVNVLC